MVHSVRRPRRGRGHLPLPAARALVRAPDPARQLRPRRDARLLGARSAEDPPQPRRGASRPTSRRCRGSSRRSTPPRPRAVEKEGGLKKTIFEWAIGVGKKVRRLERQGKQPGPLLALQHRFADKQVLSKIRGLFGGKLKLAVTGAAPINPEILEFFDAAGVLILEGWGMTETSTAATISTPEAFKCGTVGKPFPGCEVKIADDGEILVKGPNIFQGYYKNEEATAGDDRRRLAAHRRHRRDRRRRLPEDHRPQEGHHHHRGRQEHHPREPRGARSSSTRWSPSAW